MDIAVQDYTVRFVKVVATGRIDAFTVPALTEQFNGLLDDGESNFVVDLAQVSFLDSAGIAALVSLLKKSRNLGGDVKLVWPTDVAAQRILRLTRFDKVFTMFDSAESALAAGGIAV